MRVAPLAVAGITCLALSAPVLAELDAVDLVAKRFLTANASGPVAIPAVNGAYPLTFTPSRELVNLYGGINKPVVVHVFPGTLIQGAPGSVPLIVTRHARFEARPGQGDVEVRLSIAMGDMGNTIPSGNVGLERATDRRAYVVAGQGAPASSPAPAPVKSKDPYKDFNFDKPAAPTLNTARVCQFALLSLQGVTPNQYQQAFRLPHHRMTDAETTAAKRLRDVATVVQQTYGKNHEQLHVAAGRGNSSAMVHLAELHLTGSEGFWKSRDAAAAWYRKAAEAGNVHAQHQLAVIYAATAAPGQDLKEMNHWLAVAADAGRAAAMTDVGKAHHYGWGVKPNPLIAQHWYEKALKAGDTRANRQLARLRADEKAAAEKRLAQAAARKPAARTQPVNPGRTRTASASRSRSSTSQPPSWFERQAAKDRYDAERTRRFFSNRPSQSDDFWKPSSSSRSSRMKRQNAALFLLIGSALFMGSSGSGLGGGSSSGTFFDGAGNRHISYESAERANMERYYLHR